MEEGEHPAGELVHRRSMMENIAPEQLAKAEPITWKGHDGEIVHGLYYAPASDRFEGNGAPPLIVMVHGGPTGQRTAAFYDNVQFLATRGFAVLQVNYPGQHWLRQGIHGEAAR